jgi:hypothetical protein
VITRPAGGAFKAGLGLAKMGAGALGRLRSLAGRVASDGIYDVTTNRLLVLQKSCFAAGTPILTPEGAKAIETLKVGETVLSRPEHDPAAPVRIGMVDAVFKLSTPIWELQVGGHVIETTGEHPFFVVDHGWTTVNRLSAGDRLLGRGAMPAIVERVERTDRTETVYNMRVEEDHTFFVGDPAWGFSVWVHNVNCLGNAMIDAGIKRPSIFHQAAHIVPQGAFGRRSKLVKEAIIDAKAALVSAGIDINDPLNGFWTSWRNHMGTHTDEYFLELGRVMQKATENGTVKEALENMLARILGEEFL